jgi:hypothetical protein
MLVLALPMQGVMAASRLCMASLHDPAAHAVAGGVDGAHAPASADHSGSPMAAGGHAHHAPAQASGATNAETAPDKVYGTDTCKHCAACVLTAAGAPYAAPFALASAAFPGFRPLVVPVPHNVADGFERPPRAL